ncbi:MAG: hypothetical protein M1298_04670 [Chloroflexi bacterium]|nr:hypothetical protein [Chloroflexota bacterium]
MIQETTGQQEQRQPPRFYGVDTYWDRLGRFSFRYASTWARFDIEGKDGVMFVPDTNDPQTHLSGWVEDVTHHVVAEDLEVLREGIEEGLAQLPDCQVEERQDDVINNMVRFVRIFTFRDAENVRKRKAYILYADNWLITLLFQGASPEEYDYWLAMMNYSFATMKLPDELMFLTDPELVRWDPQENRYILKEEEKQKRDAEASAAAKAARKQQHSVKQSRAPQGRKRSQKQP